MRRLLAAPRHDSSVQSGSALILVMVVLAILSVVAVAGLTAAGDAMKDAQVARLQADAEGDAHAGLEHARALFTRNTRDLIGDFQNAAVSPSRCDTDWIGHAVDSVDAPAPPSGTLGRARSGTYAVDLCAASCSQGGAGNDLASGSTGRYYPLTVAVDIVSSPTTPTGRGSRTQAGLMLADVVTQAPCR